MSEDALITDEAVEAACLSFWGEKWTEESWWPANTRADYKGRLRTALSAALAAIRKTHAVVPREPTMDMKCEGMEAADSNIGLVEAGKVYRAMLSAGENHDGK